ncbi:MAG: ammonium transporter [Planctomycetota bacterium]|jgi:Amt family ammonium transporter
MDTGNTAWILMCGALVLLMTPGLAFFYGGLVGEKQVINTIKMSFIALGVITVQWALIGYSLAFSPGSSLIGGLSWIGLDGVTAEPNLLFSEDVPHLAFMAFQMMFAIITPALISGAVVGRMRFRAYALFIAGWSLLVYCPLAHWVWGPGGWIGDMGALDFAGGTVVHVSAGVSALVAAIVLGPRRRGGTGEGGSNPHNVPFVVLGASLLWFGWFGFNAGSALAADGLAVVAFVTTMLAAAAAVVAWVGIEMTQKGKTSATGAAIAAVVGLVAITPAAGFVTPMAAMIIGAAGATVSYATIALLKRTRVDDTLDVFACHGVGGIVGSLLTGVFATTVVNPGGADGLLYGNASLLGVQALSVVVAAAYAAAGTVVILVIVRGLTGLRTCDSAERVGIDVVEHDELAYWREGRAWISGGLNEALNEAAVVRVESGRGSSSS